MLKNLIFILLCFCFIVKASAALPVKNVYPDTILRIQNTQERERKLLFYIKSTIQNVSTDKISGYRNQIISFIKDNHIENGQAFIHFTESIYQRRFNKLEDAEAEMLRAIDVAHQKNDSFLLYHFYSHLAFIQTDEGNAIEAVTNYGLAKKETIKLGDPKLQQMIDVNMSDVYYKNNLYSQSLSCLNQAEAIGIRHNLNDINIEKIIYYNKSENFFRMNKPDSLQIYNQKLHAMKGDLYKLYTYQKRTDYYLYLLRYDFKDAIKFIKALQSNSLYKYNDQDQLNLANAYYNNNQPDSATVIINELLEEPLELNHPEIKYPLYKVLAQIAEAKQNPVEASHKYKLALQQAEDVIIRLTQVGNISSQIRIEEIEGSYLQKNESYKRERIWLIFTVVVALLVIVIITMVYRSMQQKRHYEKLLYAAQKEELAFINSHEVRRYLSNILGIIDVIKSSDDREKEYKQVENLLFCSVESMDQAIKNISAKLDEQLPDADAVVLQPVREPSLAMTKSPAL